MDERLTTRTPDLGDRSSNLVRRFFFSLNEEFYSTLSPFTQALVVQTLESAIHRIKIYPVDNAIVFPNTHPLHSDLSGG